MVADLSTAALLAQVERHERDAVARLTDAASGVALCRLDGTRAGDAKYWEGRCAALAEVRRELRRGGPEAQSAPERRLVSWREEAARRATGSAAWSSYLEGGVAGLSALLEQAPRVEAAP